MKLIIGTILLLAASISAQKCSEADIPVPFSCSADDTKIVTVTLGEITQTLQCAPGQVCNKKKMSPCSPCIDPSKDCDKAFECNGSEAEVTIGGSKLKCTGHKICNNKYEEPCEPCVPKPCQLSEEQQWQCVSETQVLHGGIESTCAPSQKCNDEKIAPCTPCIPKNAAKLRLLQAIYEGENE